MQMLDRLRIYTADNRRASGPGPRWNQGSSAAPDAVEVWASMMTPTHVPHDFEDCIHSTCVVYAYLIHGDHGSMTMAIACAKKALTRSLPLVPYQNDIQRRCLIWMWLVCLTSWRVQGALLSHGRCLLEQVVRRFSEATKWDSLQPLLQEFFWSDGMSALWRSSWDGMIALYCQ